jgi:hypothetical protein
MSAEESSGWTAAPVSHALRPVAALYPPRRGRSLAIALGTRSFRGRLRSWNCLARCHGTARAQQQAEQQTGNQDRRGKWFHKINLVG